MNLVDEVRTYKQTKQANITPQALFAPVPVTLWIYMARYIKAVIADPTPDRWRACFRLFILVPITRTNRL